MTQQIEKGSESFDPEGSIFLPKTQHPAREFDRWYFELMMGRGIGRDKEAEEILRLHEELKMMRTRILGGTALQ